MSNEEILGLVDHTLLKQQSTWEDIKKICDDAIKYGTASVCIPPSFVKRAKQYVDGKMKICTVIGFPNGYNTTEVKVYETKDAISNGADEIDMVINIGMLYDEQYDAILEEINRVKEVCGKNVLKVIIETCLLTQNQKIKMCEIVSNSNADYIKTSTGFSTAGATHEDIQLFSKYMADGKGIKAAGGITSFEDADQFVKEGATRLGTSRLVKLMNEK